MNFFATQLAESRASFARHRKGPLGKLFSRGLPAEFKTDQIPDRLAPHYQLLLQSGTVVWAAVAQANDQLFRVGAEDLPGVTVYSPDPYYDEHPQDLSEIASALFLLKNWTADDPELREIAERMTNEYDMSIRRPLSRSLSDSHVAFMGGTLFHRSRLPNACLQAGVLPVVIDPDRTEVNMILPLGDWPERFRAQWPNLDEMFSGLQVSSTARRVALAARRPRPTKPSVGADSNTIRVTPAAAAAFQRVLIQCKIKQKAYLQVGLHLDGPMAGQKFVGAAPIFDSHKEQCFESNGVSVTARNEHVPYLRGAVVDYDEGTIASGFIVRLANQ